MKITSETIDEMLAMGYRKIKFVPGRLVKNYQDVIYPRSSLYCFSGEHLVGFIDRYDDFEDIPF